MKKLITFSLWGEDPKYCVGALRNAELAPQIYPGWTCRFYLGVAPDPRDDPDFDPAKVVAGGLLGRTLFELSTMEHVEIVYLNEPANWTGMFWRFYPASEDDVDVFISRDCDSRLSLREAEAVQEWLTTTPMLVHSMGDHPHHFNPRYGLMGGMFGMKRYACPQLKDLVEQFRQKYPNAWQCDQDFLKDHIYPLVKDKIFAHSDLHGRCCPFPTPREGDNFVGAIIGPNEERLHPEHHEMLQ